MKRIEIIGVDTSSLPKISGEESRQYLLEIKNGNEEKKNEFINANIRLVLSIVQRFSNGRGIQWQQRDMQLCEHKILEIQYIH